MGKTDDGTGYSAQEEDKVDLVKHPDDVYDSEVSYYADLSEGDTKADEARQPAASFGGKTVTEKEEEEEEDGLNGPESKSSEKGAGSPRVSLPLPAPVAAPSSPMTESQSPAVFETRCRMSDTPSSVTSLMSDGEKLDTGGGDDTMYDIGTPSSPLSDVSDRHLGEYDVDYEGGPGNRVIRIKPKAEQWEDFPRLLAFARQLGAREDGCFKLVLPDDLRGPIADKPLQVLPSNAYRAKTIRKTSFWQLSTVRTEGEFYTPEDADEVTDSVDTALKSLKTIFRRNVGRQMRAVRYRPDVPAWTTKQRQEAGVPAWSPIHPLRGDKLDVTKAIIPGIHTPYVYESAPHFGAAFQIHAEDYRLLSLNHLYRGRKIWIVVPCTAIESAEKALGRDASGPASSCSQFMRHRAEFFFPEKLDKLGIPYRIVDQRPGETMVILPDAYHEGFSTGYTLAEAKNYADDEWSTEMYKPCEVTCQLETAIPAEYMRILREGEERIDLCELYDDAGKKREAEEEDDDDDADDNGGNGVKRVKI
jgi:jumonji domain-containing protein 2